MSAEDAGRGVWVRRSGERRCNETYESALAYEYDDDPDGDYAPPYDWSLVIANRDGSLYDSTEVTHAREVSTTVRVALPRARAWELLRDLSLAHNYVPGLVKTEITTAARQGVGASRKVYQSETSGIDETVEEWNEGHGFLIRLHRGPAGPPFPFAEAHFRYAIDDDGDATRLTTALIYTVRGGAVGRFLDAWVLRGIIDRTIRDVALSQKCYYESGTPVTKRQLKEARAAFRGGA